MYDLSIVNQLTRKPALAAPQPGRLTNLQTRRLALACEFQCGEVFTEATLVAGASYSMRVFCEGECHFSTFFITLNITLDRGDVK